MSQVPEGYVRVRMIRHEYSAAEWATPYRGRLLSGEVYDIPELDHKGKPLAAKWLGLGVCTVSYAEQTHYDELRQAQMDMAMAGGMYDATMSRGAQRSHLAPDGPVQKGMTPEEIEHPDEFPAGGLREITPEQAAAMDRGQGMKRPFSGEWEAHSRFTDPNFTGAGADPNASFRAVPLREHHSTLEHMPDVFRPQAPAQGSPRPAGPAEMPQGQGGAFSVDELSDSGGGGDDPGDRPVFNRHQLLALQKAGFDSPEKLDKASDEELDAVEGIGMASINRYREEQKARESKQQGSGGPVAD